MDRDLEKLQSTSEFIQIVKEEKAIYDFTDPDYKHSENKALAWQRIALKTGMTVEAARRRWKNLRDSYTKYLKAARIQNETNSKKYQFWAHAQAMDFLKPFQGPSRSRIKKDFDNIPIINANDYETIYNDDDQNYDQNYAKFGSQLYDKMQSNSSELRNSSFEHQNTSYNIDNQQYDPSYEIPEYCETQTNVRDVKNEFYSRTPPHNPSKKISLKATDLDATSLFFLSLAKSVRKMPTKYQARVKVKCLQIVNEMELNLETSKDICNKKKFATTRDEVVVNSEHFTYEMSPSNVEAMIEITSSDDEQVVDNGPN